jgi:hypothetical protein
MNKDFNYWAEEHYVLKIVTGSELDCMKVWKNDLQTYPSVHYGTHIYSRKFSENETTIVIKRFKTKELCEIHLQFPPTYAREKTM